MGARVYRTHLHELLPASHGLHLGLPLHCAPLVSAHCLRGRSAQLVSRSPLRMGGLHLRTRWTHEHLQLWSRGGQPHLYWCAHRRRTALVDPRLTHPLLIHPPLVHLLLCLHHHSRW